MFIPHLILLALFLHLVGAKEQGKILFSPSQTDPPDHSTRTSFTINENIFSAPSELSSESRLLSAQQQDSSRFQQIIPRTIHHHSSCPLIPCCSQQHPHPPEYPPLPRPIIPAHNNKGWIPPRPRPRPPLYGPPPPHHHHNPHPPPTHLGWVAVKPGSCVFKSPLGGFFGKFFGDNDKGNKGVGWGGEPPSQNAGFHFYRRHDQWGDDTGNFHAPVGWGRLFGGIRTGWGTLNHHHCHADYHCPGLEKCCDGVCKVPSGGLHLGRRRRRR